MLSTKAITTLFCVSGFDSCEEPEDALSRILALRPSLLADAVRETFALHTQSRGIDWGQTPRECHWKLPHHIFGLAPGTDRKIVVTYLQ